MLFSATPKWVDDKRTLTKTEKFGTCIIFFLLCFTLVAFRVSGRLPLPVVRQLLGLQEFRNQIRTVQVVFWLPRVIFPATQVQKSNSIYIGQVVNTRFSQSGFIISKEKKK